MAYLTEEKKHSDEVRCLEHAIFQLRRIIEINDTFDKIELLNHNIAFNLMLKEFDEIFFDLDNDLDNDIRDKFKKAIENYKETIKKLEGDFDKNTLSFRKEI